MSTIFSATPARGPSLLFFCALVLSLCAPSMANAQRWAVVRSGVGDPTEADRAARVQLIDALMGTGIELRVDADAAARVEDYHSVEPFAVESDRIEELRAAVTALEEHAALRHRDAARREAERIRELSEGLSSQFAEQSEVAERLFAACVAEAWLHIQLREREEARTGLQQCRELHPDAEINPVTVAPPVVDMLREIDAELSRRPTFSLTLSGVPAGCELRMDGRRRATAPDPIPNIVPGEHRIEVVCEGMRRRRIHRVIVGAENRTLPFDVRFDDVLRTRPSALGQSPEVRLDYASEDDEREHRIDDALVIAGLLEASDIVLVSHDRRGLRFDRITAGSTRIAATVIVESSDFTGATVARAATALLEGQRVDLSQPDARALTEEEEGPSTPRASGPSDAPLIGGVVMAVAGAAAFGASVGTYVVADGASNAMQLSSPSSPDWALNRDTRSAVLAATYGLSIGGSALATASLPLWLPQTPGEVPWWSLVLGAVGVGLAVPAFVLLPSDGLRVDAARPGLYYDADPSIALWASAAVPFLAVPIIYLIRLATDPAANASASIDVTSERAVVTVSGVF